MVGELQRIADFSPGSKDGWSVGGPATLFTTGALVKMNSPIPSKDTTLTFVDSAASGKLMSNGFFGSPGSAHNNIANFGFGDGSAHFLSESIDPGVFVLLGSMADHVDVSKSFD